MSNDFTRMAKRVKRLPQHIEDAVDSNMGAVFEQMTATAKMNLAGNGSVVTGTLLSSIRHMDNPSSLMLSSTDTGYSTHVTRAGAPHGPYVEYGTGLRQGTGTPNSGARFKAPSTPPYEDILTWMIRKSISPREYNTVYGAAAAIAEDISDYGNKSHPFMRPAWKAHRRQMSIAHRNGVRTALKRF